MRISKIALENYRQFRKLAIDFPQHMSSDLHLFVAHNGTAKTNIINAINWCLYGDEPYLSGESQQLPILNQQVMREIGDTGQADVIVEVYAVVDKDEQIMFERKCTYVWNNKSAPMRHGITSRVLVNDTKGNTQVLIDDEASNYVARSIPLGIREFFFFDGARLDNYFKHATAENINLAVLKISQIDLLNKVSDRLMEVRREIEKEVSKGNPTIEKARKEYEDVQNKLEELKNRVVKEKEQVEIAENKIGTYEDELKSCPNAEELEDNRKALKSRRVTNQEQYDKLMSRKCESLFEYGRIIPLVPALLKTDEIIRTKHVAGEIPPVADVSLLDNILATNKCEICKRSLDSNSREEITKLRQLILMSSTIGKELMQIEGIVTITLDRANRFSRDIEDISGLISNVEKELRQIQTNIDSIDSQLEGQNIERIKNIAEERRKFEKIRDEKNRLIGRFNKEIEDKQDEVKDKEKAWDRETKKEQALKSLVNERDACFRIANLLNKCRDTILIDTRDKIRIKTKEIFFSLLWKKHTFADVLIEDDYRIRVLNDLGYDCLGSLSSGERELLALSFTLALHDVSGFDSSILIDNPVIWLDPEHKHNFSNALVKVSKNKQVILLFHTDEYTPAISAILDSEAATRRRIKLTAQEKEVVLEVL